MAEATIRTMTEADVEAAIDAYEAVAGEGTWIGGEAPVARAGQRVERLERIRRNEDLMLVVEVDGAIVGEIGIFITHGRGDLGMHLLAEYRGQGIGSMMMARAIEWARAQGLTKLALEVWPHNERAIALYEKFGFVREGYHPQHWRRRNGESWDTISMGLVL